MSNPFKKPDLPAALANPPTVTPAARLPSPDDAGVIEARRREQEKILGRAGRASTILTGRGAGGAAPTADAYSSATL